MKADNLDLSVGTRLYLQRSRLDGVTEVLPCSLLHNLDGRELVVRPHGPLTHTGFVCGQSYGLRIANGTQRQAFTISIIKIEAPAPGLLHLSYPEAIHNIHSRRSPRHPIDKQVRLSLHSGEEKLDVYLHDISRNGACLIAEHSLARGDDVLNIELRDPINQSLITLHCLVRYVMFDMVNGVINYRHGVEFQFRDDEEQLQLENFIEYLLHEKHGISTRV